MALRAVPNLSHVSEKSLPPENERCLDFARHDRNFPRVKPFLTANWRYLAMMNFVVDPAILAPFVPAGTELDFYEGETFISVVGFLFLDTRVLGISVPLHRDFEEVNLRFYVKRKSIEGWKRGVVFVRELVPRRAIAAVARVFYGERYAAVPMRHSIVDNEERRLSSLRMAARREVGIACDERQQRTSRMSPSVRTKNSSPNTTGVIPPAET